MNLLVLTAVQAIIFSFILVAGGVLPSLQAIAEEIQAEEKAARKKIDPTFYSKLQILAQEDGKRDYIVILSIKKDFENLLGSSTDIKNNVNPVSEANKAKNNKDKAAEDLATFHNAKDVYKLNILSFVYARVPVEEIFKLAKYSYISAIDDGELEGELSGQDAPNVDSNQLLVNLDPPRELIASHGKLAPEQNLLRQVIKSEGTGYTGNNVRVAIIDTGIRQNHPALLGKIIYQANCENQTSCQEGSGNFFGDIDDHGTPIAGIIAAGTSTDQFRGVAHDVDIINARIAFQVSKIPMALDWAMTKGADVANISVGLPGVNQDIPSRAVDEAVDNGLVVVAAIGKGGAVNNPGTAFNSITVGLVDDNDSGNRDLSTLVTDTTYTTFGPVLFDGRTKPDVVAPGMDIFTTTADESDADGYKGKRGASFAAAAVTGAVAQLIEKNPTWNPAQIKAAIKQKAFLNSNLLGYSENQRGKGIVDIAQSLTLTASTIDYSLAYGINLSTYIAHDSQNNSVKHKFAKETTGSNIGAIYVHSGEVSNEIAPYTPIYSKLSFSGIKVNSITKTLTDSKLFAGPHVDLTGDGTNSWVTYIVDGDRIQLLWTTDGGSGTTEFGGAQGTAIFYSGGGSKTFEAVQYLDYDIGSSASNDKATRDFSPYTVYTAEQQFPTKKNFHLRDVGSSAPYIVYIGAPIGTVNEWILVRKATEAPSNNPSLYWSSTESLNSAVGTNLVIYDKGSHTGSVVGIGPSVYISWTTPP